MRWSVVVAIVGCAPPPPVVVPPPPQPVFAKPFVFTPEGEPLRYGEPLPPPVTTSFDDAVIAATKTTADPRLFRVCASLAAIHDHLEASTVELAWNWNGVVEPPSKPIVVRDDDPQQAIAALGKVPPGSHIGIGHFDGTAVLVVTTPRVVMTPFARSAPIEGGFVIGGKLEQSAGQPQVQVQWDDQSVQRFEPTLKARAFQAPVGCQNRPGRARVSIIGLVGTKASLLARFPVWCGREPSRTATIDPLHDANDDRDPDRAAQRLFTLLQRERVTSGLPALVWDDHSAATARQHAADMRATLANDGASGQFHHSQIVAASVLEYMAVGSTADDAFTKLMANSERRANAMSAAVTSAGIGVAIGDDRQIYVAQIFLRTPPTIVPEAVATDLENRIHDANPDILPEPQLTQAATDIAEAIGKGADDHGLKKLLQGAQQRTKCWLEMSTSETVDLASVDPIKLVTIPKTDHIGIAVFQGHHPKLGDNAISIVIMMCRTGKKSPVSL